LKTAKFDAQPQRFCPYILYLPTYTPLRGITRNFSLPDLQGESVESRYEESRKFAVGE